MKNRNIILTTILLTLGSFALPQRTHAVSPAPDGGYPGQNTAEGQSALLHLAGGTYNTALGWASLDFNVTGNFNTAVGAATLLNNTASENTATGAGALLTNTTGSENTATGGFALLNNIGGVANTADGAEALLNNTTGNDNTATGRQALFTNTTGSSNTAIGESALFDNTDGGANTAIGANVLQSNTHGHNNTAIGINALGGSATGNFNIGLGDNAGVNVTSASNVICIGVDGNNVDNACYIGQIFGATSSGGTAVLVNSNGRLGTMTSSARFKDEIKPMGAASEAILALKPVTFRYKKELDPDRIPQFGLVAEDVAAVNPDLVVRDKEGKPYSVRYEQINAMLLNEFLKAHRKIQDQEATITQLRKEMETVVAHAKEQDSRIQKVSDQIEISKARPGSGQEQYAKDRIEHESAVTRNQKTKADERKQTMKNRSIILTTIVLTLGSFALAQRTQAVSPAPDGGYPGFNTAEGQSALFSLTTGDGNTAVGWFSLWSNAAGSFNTATGAGTLLFNTADENTAFGAAALLNNTSGTDNTATGAAALSNNTTGGGNTANGVSALQSNTDGFENTATGADALMHNTTGAANTATGTEALFGTTGNNNTGTGAGALAANFTGDGNTAIGRSALGITTGGGNTALGTNAGNALTSGNLNIDIGADVIGVAGESNTIRIGANLDDTPGASACHIGGIYNQSVNPGTASSMAIDATGKLGTMVSSRRFKHDIKPMDKASEAILALKPVTFHYKSDSKNTPCFGLIAEEVAGVNPDLVVRNKNGEIWSVRYDQVNAMLLNEFLKQHRKVQEQQTTIGQLKSNAARQEATISELKSDLQTVVARLKDHDSKIQRVSAEVEMNKRSPHVVATNP